MRRQLRDLDFGAIVARVAAATNATRRASCHGTIQADVDSVRSPADAVELLRNHVALAALREAHTLEGVRVDQPLVQALVRVQHHPLAAPVPTILVDRGIRGPDAGPRLTEIAAEHPELAWDIDAVQALIITAIRTAHGDHELDDAEPPWVMHWSPAASAAYALLALVTLRVFGDLR